MSRYRITSGHPIYSFWIEDSWDDYEIVATARTGEEAQEIFDELEEINSIHSENQ